MLITVALQVAKIIGLLLWENWHPITFKIGQSGHTVDDNVHDDDDGQL